MLRLFFLLLTVFFSLQTAQSFGYERERFHLECEEILDICKKSELDQKEKNTDKTENCNETNCPCIGGISFIFTIHLKDLPPIAQKDLKSSFQPYAEFSFGNFYKDIYRPPILAS